MASQPYDTRIAVPKAQVAPMLRSETKEKLPPPPTNQDDGDYVMPDDHDPNLKPVQMDRELEAVLKLRRESLYTETEEVNTKQSSEKPPSAAVQWSGNSSTI
ncbi:hypothetical protein KUCAC02_004890 [Chaenocephalus aceratus]|uniref:Uncharacterized protein n=1 Tax=Chaenocephalus aceratus TaxID=36190 RepID=A0ACB9WZX3_CHAAC|nr:hypothetical protein KUCAC02_004890 [Chaenocephalus aceratus]